MFQHYGDKHASVISDELQGYIQLLIKTEIEFQRALRGSF